VGAASALGADSEQSFLSEGRALRARKQNEAALDAFLRGADAFPDSAALHQEAARTSQDLGRPESAAEHYEAAIKLKPDSVPALISLGVLRSGAGRLDEAARLLKSAADLDTGSLAAHHNLAIVRERLGDLDGALREYRRSAEIDPREVKVHHGIGSVLEKLGKLDEAAKELEVALAIDPAFSPACYRLSAVYLRLGRKDEGEGCLRRFRELKAREHLSRVDGLIQSQDIRGAIRECERALDAQADLAEAHGRLGALYLRDGSPSRALEHARRAAELDPKATRLANLAWALHQNEKREEALEWIDKAILLEPEKKELQEERRAILDSKPRK